MATDDLIELYLTHLAERGCTDATLDNCRRVLARADRRLPLGLDQANEDELRAYLVRRDKPLSIRSRRTYRTVLNCFYEWAVDARLLRSNPMVKIRAPKVPDGMPRVAEDDQVRWVLTEAADPYRLWAVLAAFGNLRCIEVSRLRREDVTERDIVVHLGKGNEPGVIPTHPLVWDAVRELPPGPITDCTPSQVSIRFWKYCRRNGIYVSMHLLRGWYATQGYAATNDLLAVQRNMRHKDPRTTAGYIRTTGHQARAVVDGLPTFGLSAAAMTAAHPVAR